MFKRGFHKWLGALAVVALLAGAVATGSAVWPTESGGGTQEGIQVHGHWTIEVSDPDGTLVERREFDNALQPQGAEALAKFLGRDYTVGRWRVEVTSTYPDKTPCLTLAGNPAVCELVEPTDPTTGVPYYFHNLTVEVPTSGANEDKLVLSGILTAQRDATINQMQTYVHGQDSSVAPASTDYEDYENSYIFTLAKIDPVDVSEGQQVAVTVVISFS